MVPTTSTVTIVVVVMGTRPITIDRTTMTAQIASLDTTKATKIKAASTPTSIQIASSQDRTHGTRPSVVAETRHGSTSLAATAWVQEATR